MPYDNHLQGGDKMKNQLRMYLVKAREKLGYSQYRAASEAMMSHQHYNRIENGRIGEQIQFRTLVELASALEIPIKKMWEEECAYQLSLIRGQDNEHISSDY